MENLSAAAYLVLKRVLLLLNLTIMRILLTNQRLVLVVHQQNQQCYAQLSCYKSEKG